MRNNYNYCRHIGTLIRYIVINTNLTNFVRIDNAQVYLISVKDRIITLAMTRRLGNSLVIRIVNK